ncbi:Na+/H+ antiporter subunit E [Phytopseudomonas dryadis]|uniref:Na+/H+ antiporter subunit E n=1 Tax=Phytopseudomonas dryadis TaxID=2487520 RepID=A0A4Q9R3X5_9GAMM|nr:MULTISPECIES: Na+/H+ antiporter subunit E [Pseudomonas]TBU94684.1 Na+/H+ antiporter subunit E [Pseudomonas dryadis]TBV06754.1 Na+/H+ antiporter subunit E [Pseudomonas dryadis]TBV18589.1 Na+/H+ antiporter subunit E [Pseudomonas sp. FRB 230]
MSLSRWLPHPMLTLLLTGVWLLLVNAPSLGHLLLGAFLGWGIALLCSGFMLEVPRLRRPLRLCTYMLMVLWDIVVANLHVARLVLGSTRKLRPAFVEVPMDIENEFVLSVLACIVSLTPGTVSSGLSADHKTLLLHGLDVADDEALIAQVKSRYEAPLMEIFECSTT